MTLSASTDDACDDDLDVDAVKGDVDFCRRAGATPDEVDGDDDGDVVAADLKVFCAKDGDIDFSIRCPNDGDFCVSGCVGFSNVFDATFGDFWELRSPSSSTGDIFSDGCILMGSSGDVTADRLICQTMMWLSWSWSEPSSTVESKSSEINFSKLKMKTIKKETETKRAKPKNFSVTEKSTLGIKKWMKKK